MNTELLGKIKNALKENGFSRISSIPVDSDMAAVRYFQNPFKADAFDIRDIVKGVFASNNNPQNFRVYRFPDPKGKDAYGWVEVWLPASRPVVAPSPTPKP